MRVTGFSLLLAAIAVLAGLAAVALPAGAADPRSPLIRPAETPPHDFTAGQYIDSAGCVFLRVDGGWQARVDRSGEPVCGYPPTLSARRTRPDAAVALFPPHEEAPADRMRRELTQAIIPNLHAGELLPDSDAGARRGAALGATVPQAGAAKSGGQAPHAPDDSFQLGRMMAKAPDLGRQMVRASHIDRLCDLIGGATTEPGGTVAGLCGMGATVLPAQGTAPLGRGKAEAVSPAAPVTANGKGAAAVAPVRTSRAKAGTAGATPRTGAAGSQPRQPTRDPARLIPPGARYVQIGVFGNPQDAGPAAQRLAALGVPVVRSRRAEGRPLQVMVGPLDGREAIVRMIDRLARAGYTDLVARR